MSVCSVFFEQSILFSLNPSPALAVSPFDKGSQAFVISGFITGNMITSLRLSCCVMIANILSIHIPNHDCGGIPYSIAVTKSSSEAVASWSHCAAA
jgi:hypothetical protein